MQYPITTPCAHNFCKACLQGAFAGKSLMRERSQGGRSLRAQKNVKTCPFPLCTTDIADFLENPQVLLQNAIWFYTMHHSTLMYFCLFSVLIYFEMLVP